MTPATFRIIRAYTPAVFSAVWTAVSMVCVYRAFVIAAAVFNVEIPQ